ncbi:NAD(P)/FAD-dependent oxidoreductase [Streptomyces sp. NPDC057137]|uniref:NAD(P)/FAD-dependent oxidoreductase n=1 Tax=Streptomyces sp. NPDC057137 TaxID=3346030 RepID=UPI00363F6DCF
MTGIRGIDGTLRHIAVIGASPAGIRTSEALRRRGFDGRLTVVDAADDIPPGLDAEPLPNTTAEGLDLAGRTVRLSGGRTLDFDGLVIATGAGARRPAGLRSGHPAVFALRTFENAEEAENAENADDTEDAEGAEDTEGAEHAAYSRALRAALAGSPRVAVVGAGFTGCQVASYCRDRGLDVTVVESGAAPLEGVVGTDMGRELAELHRDHGTVMMTGTPAVSLRPDGLVTADGGLVPADVVVIAAGFAPRTEWLRGSGLDVEDGVLLDATCAAVGASRVVAAGSVARWFNPLFGEVMRVEHRKAAEHRSDTAEQAVAAADTLLADGECALPFESLPYFESEQYGTEIQFVGLAAGVPHVVAGTVAERRFVAVYTDGQFVTGALCVNSPSQLDRYRRMVAARVPADVVFAPPTMLKSAV